MVNPRRTPFRDERHGNQKSGEDEWLVQIADPIQNLRDYIEATTKLRRALAPHITYR
jgi:hypothetical protein